MRNIYFKVLEILQYSKTLLTLLSYCSWCCRRAVFCMSTYSQPFYRTTRTRCFAHAQIHAVPYPFKMSTVFESCEQQFAQISAEVSSRINKISRLLGGTFIGLIISRANFPNSYLYTLNGPSSLIDRRYVYRRRPIFAYVYKRE